MKIYPFNNVSSAEIRQMAEEATGETTLLYIKDTEVTWGYRAEERMKQVMEATGAAMVYADRYIVKNGVTEKAPVIDYQLGALRDDFDFGAVVMVRTSALKEAACRMRANYSYAGFYDLRLKLSEKHELVHINEYLYTEQERDLRLSGQKQFDYVDPRDYERQKEMELACTEHLKVIGAYLPPRFKAVDFDQQTFEVEASVIIPVKNRVKTIGDAINSVLQQETDFDFNVIVVDNHSTDGTTELIKNLAVDERVIHVVPERTDLGIGGCWNMAIDHPQCGKFAIQLDSDDMYSDQHTLHKMVNAFYEQQCAMVVGSYQMTDFDLNTLPPGIIDHKEWTPENGRNNALRINGLGAPRAFFTPLLRKIGMPNTSYGEDYAVGLAFCRKFKIGRIYDELYLCRRWEGNSDASLTPEQVNRNNVYKDSLRTMEIINRRRLNDYWQSAVTDGLANKLYDEQLPMWKEAQERYEKLANVVTAEMETNGCKLVAQYNPARIVSTGAKVDAESIKQRPCFLCEVNRPAEQISSPLLKKYYLLLNPNPILPKHFTIPLRHHRKQQIFDYYEDMMEITSQLKEMFVFYNGPKCGASAPDHAHFQAGTSGLLPLQMAWQRLSRNLKEIISLNDNERISLIEEYPCPALLITSRSQYGDEQLFRRLYESLPQREDETEPMMNIVSWRHDDDYLSVVFPRRKHRPSCYFTQGIDQYLISPGALDMAGLIITPREEDYERLSPEMALSILQEVALTKDELLQVIDRLKASNTVNEQTPTFNAKEPDVTVGIVSGQKISFMLNSPYVAKGEIITGPQTVEFAEGGILWRGTQYRNLTFTPQEEGASFSLEDVTIGVNFHWERQETQTFEGTLHIIVESDHIVAINQLPVERYLTSVISSEMSASASLEFLKAHAVISRSWLLAQIEKRRRHEQGGDSFFSFTKKDDELIRWYDREDHTIFDVCADDHCQRYQGITKANNKQVAEAISETRGQVLTYENEICDARFSKCCGGQTEEFQYCWEDTPKPYLVSFADPYCNTSDKTILKQVLNDFDQETPDFYRWTVEYSQAELSELISRKLKEDFGEIQDLVPLERGKSGRIWKLKIVGTKKTFTIGKELEIRRALSETHLLSSAFDVERQGDRFILHGKGWGHGVGLCQIGAAVMGEQGKTYDEILLFYYRNAKINQLYE